MPSLSALAIGLNLLLLSLCLLLTRLCGYTPFRSDDPAKLAAETQRGKIEFRESSFGLLDLVRALASLV